MIGSGRIVIAEDLFKHTITNFNKLLDNKSLLEVIARELQSDDSKFTSYEVIKLILVSFKVYKYNMYSSNPFWSVSTIVNMTKNKQKNDAELLYAIVNHGTINNYTYGNGAELSLVSISALDINTRKKLLRKCYNIAVNNKDNYVKYMLNTDNKYINIENLTLFNMDFNDVIESAKITIDCNFSNVTNPLKLSNKDIEYLISLVNKYEKSKEDKEYKYLLSLYNASNKSELKKEQEKRFRKLQSDIVLDAVTLDNNKKLYFIHNSHILAGSDNNQISIDTLKLFKIKNFNEDEYIKKYYNQGIQIKEAQKNNETVGISIYSNSHKSELLIVEIASIALMEEANEDDYNEVVSACKSNDVKKLRSLLRPYLTNKGYIENNTSNELELLALELFGKYSDEFKCNRSGANKLCTDYYKGEEANRLTAVKKLVDKNGKIVGYIIKDTKYEEVYSIPIKKLKEAISTCRVRISNLTLTKDGRLYMNNK